MKNRFLPGAFLIGVLVLLVPGISGAHCDTLGGPVIADARAALDQGDVTPVLKWVKKENEPEIRDLFKKTLVVRTKGSDAKEIADRYFFETLVRIHRAGEGAPFTGLKPAGEVEPSIAAADKAIESGSVDSLVKMIGNKAAEGIRHRYEAVLETRKHAADSVDAGRKYVVAYVDFTHYVERLDQIASSDDQHGAPRVSEDHGQHLEH